MNRVSVLIFPLFFSMVSLAAHPDRECAAKLAAGMVYDRIENIIRNPSDPNFWWARPGTFVARGVVPRNLVSLQGKLTPAALKYQAELLQRLYQNAEGEEDPTSKWIRSHPPQREELLIEYMYGFARARSTQPAEPLDAIPFWEAVMAVELSGDIAPDELLLAEILIVIPEDFERVVASGENAINFILLARTFGRVPKLWNVLTGLTLRPDEER